MDGEKLSCNFSFKFHPDYYGDVVWCCVEMDTFDFFISILPD